MLATALPFAALFGRFAWWLELFSHFAMHYAAVLTFVAGVAFALRQRWLGFAATGLALYYAFLAGDKSAPDPARDSQTRSLRVLVANVYTGNRRHDAVLAAIDTHDPDVVALLEVNRAWVEALSAIPTRLPFAVEEPRPDNFGIAVYSRIPSRATVTSLSPSGVPSVELVLGAAPGELRLLATHTLPPVSAAYARDRDRHLSAVAAWSRSQSTPHVVVGDFNTTRVAPSFSRVLAGSDLRDGRRGFGRLGTWPANYGWLGVGIDHVFPSHDVALDELRTVQVLGSDHHGLLAGLRY